MKKTALTLLTGLAFAASAQAGETYSAKAPAPAPMPDPCLWTWFAGGSGGYVDDIDNDMWTIHLGKEYKCPGSNCSHAIFLEVGWTDWDDSDRHDSGDTAYPSYDIDYDYSVVPITLNYKYECQLTNRLNWYVGGGLGVAISSIDIDWSDGHSDDDSETNFYGHLFAGLVYNVSDAFEIFGGARYLYMDGNDDINGVDIPGVLDDDFFYELGVRYNF